jgi:hypothetical protein
VTKPDGHEEQGYIDTLIEQGNKAIIIDYKTHDMSSWTLADAEYFGHEHGPQVQEYVHSPGRPSNTTGYIVAAGRSPDDAQVKEAYAATLSLYGVEARFPCGGEPEAVAQTVRQIAQERGIR